MKKFTFIFFTSLSCSVCAQKSIFVRVYDFAGEKINTGHLLAVTDTSLQLKGEPVDIPVRNIGFIKTKRSAGNNVLVGSVIGAFTGAVVGAVTGDPDPGFMKYTPGE